MRDVVVESNRKNGAERERERERKREKEKGKERWKR
jgi:hypothetical protein